VRAPSLWNDERDANDDSTGGAIRGLVFALPASVVFWLIVILALASVGCHHDDSGPTGCEQVCYPCSGVGDPRVYEGFSERTGLPTWPPLVCLPDEVQMAQDKVCFQDSDLGTSGVQPVCYYACNSEPCGG